PLASWSASSPTCAESGRVLSAFARRPTTSSWGRRSSHLGRSAWSARSGSPRPSSSVSAEQASAGGERLPRQRRGTTPQMIGRYPDYDVLDEADHWDEVTRRVVLDRVHDVPPFRFFDQSERETVKAFCDTITA